MTTEKTEIPEETRTTEKTGTLDERKQKKMERNRRRRVESHETWHDITTKPDPNMRAWEQQRGRGNVEKPATSQKGVGYFRSQVPVQPPAAVVAMRHHLAKILARLEKVEKESAEKQRMLWYIKKRLKKMKK
ncbi:hypothetical protein NDU88_002988 [Pleurodeles waltl]|uniref:Uncharacterized protein n=1 Tax=Pleurodeles waltl TaxID=8319 RepID=A0AAV7PB03_PLEWA|nr:hypothetical protein NDU88_002988 [Pleurodeles waltl]